MSQHTVLLPPSTFLFGSAARKAFRSVLGFECFLLHLGSSALRGSQSPVVAPYPCESRVSIGVAPGVATVLSPQTSGEQYKIQQEPRVLRRDGAQPDKTESYSDVKAALTDCGCAAGGVAGISA